MPSMSCISSLLPTSLTPISETIFSMVSITIFRYYSLSSFRSSTISRMISPPPTFRPISTVVSTNCL